MVQTLIKAPTSEGEEFRKVQVIRDEDYKKVSLEVGRDIRFPKVS